MPPNLSIELVPRTCWFSNLRSELLQSDWDILRKQSYANAKNRCEICGGKGEKHPVECHEIWNYDDSNNIQTLIGLISLCPNCHLVKHRGLAEVRGLGTMADEHLAKINGWSREEAAEYVEFAFEQWQNRSNFEWKLDLTWLNKKGISLIKNRR